MTSSIEALGFFLLDLHRLYLLSEDLFHGVLRSLSGKVKRRGFLMSASAALSADFRKIDIIAARPEGDPGGHVGNSNDNRPERQPPFGLHH